MMLGLQDPAVAQYHQQQVVALSQQAAAEGDKLLVAIAEKLKPGMTESEARPMAVALMRELGIETHWHLPYIRFGSNTVCTFLDKSPQDLVLQEEDIALIDIGPVINVGGNAIEADVGVTLTYGQNQEYQAIKTASEALFADGMAYWRKHNPTGVELHEYLDRRTAELGYVFHLKPAGHLIGTFPHQGWKKGLNTYPYPAEPGLWILEIHIRTPDSAYGAFFEQILV